MVLARMIGKGQWSFLLPFCPTPYMLKLIEDTSQELSQLQFWLLIRGRECRLSLDDLIQFIPSGGGPSYVLGMWRQTGSGLLLRLGFNNLFSSSCISVITDERDTFACLPLENQKRAMFRNTLIIKIVAWLEILPLEGARELINECNVPKYSTAYRCWAHKLKIYYHWIRIQFFEVNLSKISNCISRHNLYDFGWSQVMTTPANIALASSSQ